MIKAMKIQKCKSNPAYFAENYVKKPFKLLEHQKEILEEINKTNKVAVLAPRQSGKSLCGIISMLHFALFNKNKTIVLHSLNHSMARELLKQLVELYEALPDWMAPKDQLINKQTSLKLGNGSKFYIYSEDLKHQLRGISLKIDFFYADEAAHIKNIRNVIEDLEFFFYSTAKILFTTTTNENAENLIKDIYKKSEQGLNDFSFVSCKWSDIPDRDWVWKKETEMLIGEKAFRQEFECQW